MINDDLESVPNVPDEELIKWLRVKISTARVEVVQYKVEFAEVINTLVKDDEPVEFGYARLLNNLATKEKPELIRMLSALMWEATKP